MGTIGTFLFCHICEYFAWLILEKGWFTSTVTAFQGCYSRTRRQFILITILGVFYNSGGRGRPVEVLASPGVISSRAIRMLRDNGDVPILSHWSTMYLRWSFMGRQARGTIGTFLFCHICEYFAWLILEKGWFTSTVTAFQGCYSRTRRQFILITILGVFYNSGGRGRPVEVLASPGVISSRAIRMLGVANPWLNGGRRR